MHLQIYLILVPDSLPPARRRSLFTLTASMFVLSSKAYNILPLIPAVKATLTDKTVSSYLSLLGNYSLLFSLYLLVAEI